ncbi:tetratricopeptide repeat protein [Moritella yayanosii]|uniref:SIR2-like domain-containing protein n=1 Tax=Moritella yayanosii TaxID=69539 RepID=A0A330LJ15_9GAMM|nr:tetratricopeptide repeat protein [Moritella yayanosii]SQD77127.1 conserved protein of unknown function [Moritella yayanosii]
MAAHSKKVNFAKEQLYERDCSGVKPDKFEQWLEKNPLEIDDWDAKNLAKHYPTIFEHCFDGDHDSGYAELERAIEQSKPSLGYAVLAWILSSGQHNMVITTNFDNLVADALSIYGEHYPHVIGHESLASYLKPMSRRSIVAKIHRDLFTSPINTEDGVAKLASQWTGALKNIFKFYTPIFIGYGGNDGSLMDFLKGLDKRDISGRPFWCYYEKGEEPNQDIQGLMEMHNGVLVATPGFDELMLRIGDVLGYDREKQKEKVEARTKKLLNTLDKQVIDMSEHGSSELKEQLTTHVSVEQRDWVDWILYINTLDDINEKEKQYQAALKQLPESYQLINNYAELLRSEQRYPEAKEHYLKALAIEPNHARIWGNYANLLSQMERYLEAEEHYQKALAIEPENTDILGNYAVFLLNQKRPDEAITWCEKSLSIEPGHFHVTTYAEVLRDLGRFEEALLFAKKAAKLFPDNPATQNLSQEIENKISSEQ